MNYKTIELEKARQNAKNLSNMQKHLTGYNAVLQTLVAEHVRLIVDPDDNTHNTWFAGAVSGGVWKTTDGGATWQILSEEFTNISTMAMAAIQP